MANKRSLKKAIKLACGNIAGECMIARELIPGINQEKIDEAVFKIADLQCETIDKVTFSFDKTEASFDSKKAYRDARSKYFRKAYHKLTSDFDASVQSIVNDMNAALPAK